MGLLSLRGALAAAGVATSLCTLAAPAGATTPIKLHTGTGDGYAQPTVDEYGTLSGCSPAAPGLFDPLGAIPPEGTVCSIGLQIFDLAGTLQQGLPAGANGCGVASPHVATLLSDTLSGTHSRFSEFTLSAFPDLHVSLWQTACTGGVLTQTYTFTNASPDPYSLRLVRDADLDVDIFDFHHNHGRLLAPGMPAVLDASEQVSVALLSGGDGALEGYRIYQSTFNGAQIFYHSWGHSGFPPDNLNGSFRSLVEPWGSACGLTLGVDETLLSPAAALTSLADTAVALQTVLDIPAGQTRTYVAQTFWGPSVPTNDPPAPNCAITAPGSGPDSGIVAGRVTFDDDQSCSVSSPAETGSAARWVRIDDGHDVYHARTDPSGNFALAVPPASYTVTLLPKPNSPESCGAPLSYGVDVQPGRFFGGNDFFVLSPGCNATVGVAATYPSNVNAVHDPFNQPCHCDEITYCVNVSNTGTSAVSGTLSVNLPGDVSYTGMLAGPLPPPPTAFATACDVGSPVYTPAATHEECCDALRDKGGTLQWTINTPIPAGGGPPSDCSVCYTAIECAPELVVPVVTTTTATIVPPGTSVCNISPGFLSERVVCSRDPNFKEVAPAGCGASGSVTKGEPLSFTVHFQNEGNGPAHRVRIEDPLAASLDLGTLEIVRASHPLTRIEVRPDRVLVLDFDGIELPPMAEDLEGSSGLVEFRVSPEAGLPDGATVHNQASIFFDHNAPIQTGTTTSTYWDDPAPEASFIVTGERCGALDLAYSGATQGVTFQWDFGPGATPQTSTLAAPTGIEFPDSGPHLVTLTVDRDGCTTTVEQWVDVPPPEAQLGSYALVAQSSITFKKQSWVVNGAAGVRSPTGTLTVFPSAGASGPGAFLAADTLALQPQAVVVDVLANQVSNPALVTGTWSPFVAPLVATPSLPSITPGAAPVQVPNATTLTLAPGAYGTVQVGNGASLVLTGGVYTFNSVSLGTDAALSVKTPSELRVKKAVLLGTRATLLPNAPVATHVIVALEGLTFSTAHEAKVTAIVLAPNATATLGSSSLFTGSLLAKDISLEPKAKAVRDTGCW